MTVRKFNVKKDDKVKVIVGKDKGKVGKILRVTSKSGRLIVENINLVKRHTKPSAQNKQGGIIEKEASVHSSNVMLMCNKCIEAIRPKMKILNDGSKVRVCRKCDEVI